ncbi:MULTISPECIES: zf-HC2 domain-containing protein [Streptosporangium]|uniref:Anti-sigma factor family protein n=1 Tax=Streptosporangium jomthongense TaxID=1193683 RepID=A0ABV8EWS1_9ACTN
MMMTCDDVRMSLGVYVLGALEPEECVLVEAHLAECEGCRAEFEELTGVAAFLEKVSQEDAAQAVSPPHAVLDRLLSARVRRRRLSRVLLSLAASVLVVGLGGTMWSAMRPAQDGASSEALPAAVSASAGGESGQLSKAMKDDRGQGYVTVPSEAPSNENSQDARIFSDVPERRRTVKGDNGPVHVTVSMAEGEGTTTVKVVVSGIAKGTPCRLDVVGADGRRQTAANWVVNKAAYDRSGPFQGSTTIPFGTVTRVEVTTAQGRVLVGVAVP